MSQKFDTDPDPGDLEHEAAHFAYVHKVRREHMTGPGETEPGLYAPNKHRICRCIYCKRDPREGPTSPGSG